MSSVKALVARSLTVAGKLLIPLAISLPVFAQPEDPRFFEYRNGSFVNRLADFSFGWFKTLDKEQKEAYHSALNHALMFADNGQKVTWYKNNASGMAVPVMTWPSGAGYCRRIYIQAIAYNVEKVMTTTACLNEVDNRWTWHN